MWLGIAAILGVTAFCAGWTCWWGYLLARRGRAGLGCVLWFLAFGLVDEMIGELLPEIAKRRQLETPNAAPPSTDSE